MHQLKSNQLIKMDTASNIAFMLQSTLIGYYKTGQIVVDTIITILIVTVFQKVVANGINLDSLLALLNRKRRIKSEYIIEGKVKNTSEPFVTNNLVIIPVEFKAIMYKMHCVGANIRSAKQYDRSTDTFTGKHYSYVINDTNDIQVTNDIWVKQSNKVDKSNDNKVEVESFSLHVMSYTLSFSELQDRIIEWVKEYDGYLKAQNDANKIYYFSYFGTDTSKKNLIFDRSIFKSNKTFDNIFFDQKRELMERLQYFINGEVKYKKLGIPHTLGLLFYGEPGCGKTSTIKAIANYTQKHVISIPLSRVETCREFTKIFMDEFIMDRYVPINSRIYVFEDIDCMSDIIVDRDQVKGKNEKNSNKVVVCLKEGPIDSESSTIKKDTLTLSYILNMIDGILEQPGRIIIMTTNKPDKLDRALLRPGRIDMKVNFGKCSVNTMKDIFEFFFTGTVHNCTQLQNGKFTPAEIFEVCHNSSDLADALGKIKPTGRSSSGTASQQIGQKKDQSIF
jgi:hypothetical protein